MSADDVPTTVISVRAEAQRTVEPDLVTLLSTIGVTDDSRQAAGEQVGALLAGVTAALAGLGGEPATAQDDRPALSWSTHSLHTWDDWEDGPDDVTRGPLERRRHRAQLELRVTVRDRALVAPVQLVLTGHDAVSIYSVHWAADPDNPGWALVRADAIRAALLKGQDYAAALGGEVRSVEHVADAGMLGGLGEQDGLRFVEQASAEADGGGAPGLDPVPQVLSAAIDARFVADHGPLPVR